MSNDDVASVTGWIAELKTDNRGEASRRLWERLDVICKRWLAEGVA